VREIAGALGGRRQQRGVLLRMPSLPDRKLEKLLAGISVEAEGGVVDGEIAQRRMIEDAHRTRAQLELAQLAHAEKRIVHGPSSRRRRGSDREAAPVGPAGAAPLERPLLRIVHSHWPFRIRAHIVANGEIFS